MFVCHKRKSERTSRSLDEQTRQSDKEEEEEKKNSDRKIATSCIAFFTPTLNQLRIQITNVYSSRNRNPSRR